MTLEILASILAYSMIINLAVLAWWAGFIFFAQDFVFRMHGRWFNLDEKQFAGIHYGAMAFYKLAILLFNVAPYVAIRIVL